MHDINRHLPYTLSFSQQTDLTEDHAYYTSRAAEIASFLAEHRQNLMEYIDFCDDNGFIADDAAFTASGQICAQMAALLAQFTTKLNAATPAGAAYSHHITALERLYRSMLLLKVSAVRLMSWSSTAFGQTTHAYHFQPSRYGRMPDRSNYERMESPDTLRWRNQMKDILGLTPAQGLIAVASGTAAFTIVFDYLIQQVLQPGFKIYAPRMIYGETDLLMREDTSLYTFTLDDLIDPAAITSRITQLQPDIVLMEGMRNSQGCPLLDIPAIIENLNNTSLDKDIYLLIDDTLLTGAYNAAELVNNPRVKVFQYLSALKYLQLGQDAGFAGAVIVPAELETYLLKWASWLGFVLYESVSLTYPAFTREEFLTRQRRQTRNAYVMAQTMQQVFAASGLKALYPLQHNHPSFAQAITLPYVGALLTLDVTPITGEVTLKNLKPLTTIVDKLIAAAKSKGLTFVSAESFGLSSPRINLNWCRRTPPCLRISAGDRSLEETTAIAQCIAEELLRALPATPAAATAA